MGNERVRLSILRSKIIVELILSTFVILIKTQMREHVTDVSLQPPVF
jgi:hypothetical protein